MYHRHTNNKGVFYCFVLSWSQEKSLMSWSVVLIPDRRVPKVHKQEWHNRALCNHCIIAQVKLQLREKQISLLKCMTLMRHILRVNNNVPVGRAYIFVLVSTLFLTTTKKSQALYYSGLLWCFYSILLKIFLHCIAYNQRSVARISGRGTENSV